MLSKNNMKLNSMRQNKRKQRFALRKLTVGVASVLLGTAVFMGGTAVNADTVDSNQVNVSQTANTGSEPPASASQSTSAASDATSDTATSDTPASQGPIDDGSTTESGAITDRTSVADPNPHTGEALNLNDGTWKQGNVGNIQNNAIINGQHFTINTNNVSEKSTEEGQFPVWWTQIDGHTYSYQYGSMSTTHKYGGPTLTNPTVYSRKLKSGQTQIARQWDLGNQVTMTELYNVTTDGLMEHLIYVTNNGNNPYEFKDLDWDLDTMLDADDQIPIIADGHGGGYIVGKITLWLQPLYGVSEYSHRWSQPETARTSLTGAKAGETVLNGMDSAIDYQFKADTIAPGKTMVWGFRECLFPEGMNPVQNGIIRATYVDQAGNEVGQAVENFYKIGDHYDTEAKQIHGYHLIKAAENASGQVSFGTTEVTYVYARDEAKITYQFIDDNENGKVVSSQVVNGFVDQRVDTKLAVPEGYELAQGQQLPSKVQFDNPGMTTTSIHLVHKIVPVTDESQLHRKVTRTIKITGLPDDTNKDKVQTAKFDRTGTTDLVTGKSTFTPWTPAEQTFEGGYMPHVEGYTIKGSIPEIVVTPSSNSSTVYLHAEKTRDNLTKVQYVVLGDDDQPVRDNNGQVKTIESLTKFEAHPTGMPVSYRQYVLNTITDKDGNVYNLVPLKQSVAEFTHIKDGVDIAPKSTFSDDADTTITFFSKEVKPVAPTTYTIEYRVNGALVGESKSVSATGFNENAYKRPFIFKNGMHRFSGIEHGENNTIIYNYR